MSSGDFFSGEKLYHDVVTYARFGEHRTATRGEEETTEWIGRELESAGVKTSSESFPVETYFVTETKLTVGQHIVDCFPLWPPCWTGPQGIRGPLALVGASKIPLKGRVAVVKVPPSGGGPSFVASGDANAVNGAAEAGAVGVLIIAHGPSEEIHSYNTPPNVPRWPIPVALVPKRSETQMLKDAERGLSAHLTLLGVDQKTQARNLAGKVQRGDRLIAVSTPKSGWFTCAGERGTGVAIFLALARWLARRESKFSYLFDCNTGHEIGGSGIRYFLEKSAPPPQQVNAWVHLGANIATWDWEETPGGLQKKARPDLYRIRCSDEALVPLVKNAVVELRGLEPVAGEGIGEMRRVIQLGYRGFGVNGGNYRYFHTPRDTPENATGPELLEPMARAMAKAIESIERLTK